MSAPQPEEMHAASFDPPEAGPFAAEFFDVPLSGIMTPDERAYSRLQPIFSTPTDLNVENQSLAQTREAASQTSGHLGRAIIAVIIACAIAL